MKKLTVKKLVALFLALGLILCAATPAMARTYVFVGGGYYPGYYHPYYGYPGYYPAYSYYPAYYPGYYGPPPPTVVYAPQPTVVSAVATGGVAATSTLAADQTSPTYVDSLGRTCRHFATTNGVGPTYGTACLMQDGSWRTVP